jgi:hypothetical protein
MPSKYYCTEIGKVKHVEYCGIYFDLSENINLGDEVILVDYRKHLMLLSYKTDSELEDSEKELIREYIPTLPGFSPILNSPIGELSYLEYDTPFPGVDVLINIEYLVNIFDKNQMGMRILKPQLCVGHQDKIYSFSSTNFDKYLRNIVSCERFISQISFILNI